MSANAAPAAATAPQPGMRVLVAGARVAGAASALALHRRGVQVTVTDRELAPAELTAAGIEVVTGEPVPERLLSGVDQVVVSPGFSPRHPLVAAALAKGLQVYSEPELAWRLRGPDAPVWLAVSGTNGKTTTTTMLAAMLRAAGLRTAALGNIGVPLVDAQTGYDVLAVELSSFQLHWSSTLAPPAGALLNLADDHLDWHGGFADYERAKQAVWRGGTAVGNLDDPRVRRLLLDRSSRRIGFTVQEPAVLSEVSVLGVADGMLVDESGELAAVADIRPPGVHNVANALAAAALALWAGVPRQAVRAGLAGYTPEPHRNVLVATAGAISYVDDSKATNPHAAHASLASYDRVVWIAGGQLKGVAIDELVRTVAPRLAGAVLFGVDRAEIAAALARHAPSLPVVEVARTDDEAMGEVVRAAVRLAQPGDTVLLAPAAASLDMFAGYAHRGAAFAAAVTALAGEDVSR